MTRTLNLNKGVNIESETEKISPYKVISPAQAVRVPHLSVSGPRLVLMQPSRN